MPPPCLSASAHLDVEAENGRSPGCIGYRTQGIQNARALKYEVTRQCNPTEHSPSVAGTTTATQEMW